MQQMLFLKFAKDKGLEKKSSVLIFPQMKITVQCLKTV